MTASAIAASVARIVQVQQHLSVASSVLLALVAFAAAAVRWIWPVTRHLTVMAHEGVHATVGSALGHQIKGIEFKLNANGATFHTGPSGALGNSVIFFVGYLGPSAFGLGAAELIRTGHIVAVVWLGFAGLIAIMAVLRLSFGWVTVTIAALVLFLIAGFAAVTVQVLTAYATAWFLLVSGIQGIRARRKSAGDSDGLKGLTGLPHGFWYRVWLAGASAALVFGATQLV